MIWWKTKMKDDTVKEVSDFSIKLKRSTAKRVRSFGKMGESYDDVINKAFDYLENAEIAREQNQLLRNLTEQGFKENQIGGLSVSELDILYTEFKRYNDQEKAFKVLRSGLY
ncbi:MAG: hypothetical protein FWH29_06650 [Methanobrevibacter sp.]|nr:hypothetical protein [Methanobrevibacter sp.]